MTMPYTIQDVRNIILRPHAGQFVIDELPLIFMCMAGLVYGGMEGMPLGGMATVIALFLFLVLLYRFICLRRICYRVGNEQLVCERGLFCRRVDYMELYRIVDFQEHQSLLQQLCGLKTVVILSTDRNSPKLDLIGIRRGNDIVAIIRERVEINKRKRESMRLRIISIWVVFVLAGLLPQLAKAQVAASNPLEWAALAEGNELINGQIDKQIKGQTQTALMQNSIAAEFNRIHEWEKQYNSYLKTANGYASSLKACTHLYNDGVRIFLTLGKLGKAIGGQPAGHRRQHEHEQPLYRDGDGAGFRVHVAERRRGQRRHGKHAHGGGTEQNPVGFERPARGIQPETASALFEPALLYPERRVEQHNGGYDRPQQRRGGPSGHVPLAQGGSHRPLKKG